MKEMDRNADQLNLSRAITVDQGTMGRVSAMLLVDIEIEDGKVVSSSLTSEYHFSPAGNGLLSFVCRHPSEKDKYPHWPPPSPRS